MCNIPKVCTNESTNGTINNAKKEIKVKQWVREDGTIITDTGKNKIPVQFYNKTYEDKHYQKHASEYAGLTQSQYTLKAATLASSAVDGSIIGFSTDDGFIVRYDKATKDLVKAYPGNNGYIKTLFKPNSGMKYYNENKKKTWKFRKGK